VGTRPGRFALAKRAFSAVAETAAVSLTPGETGEGWETQLGAGIVPTQRAIYRLF
jgi:hypothetical protein